MIPEVKSQYVFLFTVMKERLVLIKIHWLIHMSDIVKKTLLLTLYMYTQIGSWLVCCSLYLILRECSAIMCV